MEPLAPDEMLQSRVEPDRLLQIVSPVLGHWCRGIDKFGTILFVVDGGIHICTERIIPGLIFKSRQNVLRFWSSNCICSIQFFGPLNVTLSGALKQATQTSPVRPHCCMITSASSAPSPQASIAPEVGFSATAYPLKYATRRA